jgi:hypothetical protein
MADGDGEGSLVPPKASSPAHGQVAENTIGKHQHGGTGIKQDGKNEEKAIKALRIHFGAVVGLGFT